MIQIDTSSPETGQTAPQSLHISRSDQNGEDSIEFAQIWSEFVEPEIAKATPPNVEQTPIAEQNDVESSEAQPDPEAAEVKTKPHPLEIRLNVQESTQSTPPPPEGLQKSEVNIQSDPNANKSSASTVAPAEIPALGKDPSEVSQRHQAAEQITASTQRVEKSTANRPIVTASDSSATLPIPENAPEDSAVPLQSSAAPATSNAAFSSPNTVQSTSHTASSTSGVTPSSAPNANGLLPRQIFTDRPAPQPVVPDQDSAARPSVAAPISQAVQPAASPEKPTVQIPLAAALHVPVRTATQKQGSLPPLALPTQELPQAPQTQTAAIPNPVVPAITPSLPIATLPKAELSIPMLNVAPEIELAALQPQHSNSVNTAPSIAPTMQPIAPHVASQIAAAISQSSATTTEILLNPEELGRVRMSLSNADAGMTVNIFAERGETMDLMRRNIELLARELRDMGYDNPSFTFGERSDGSNDTWDDEHSEQASENSSTLTESPTPRMHVTLTGGLDLKL